MGRAVDLNFVQMATEGTVETVDGGEIRLVSDTICFHDDTLGVAQLVRAARDALARAGVEIAPLSRWLS